MHCQNKISGNFQINDSYDLEKGENEKRDEFREISVRCRYPFVLK